MKLINFTQMFVYLLLCTLYTLFLIHVLKLGEKSWSFVIIWSIASIYPSKKIFYWLHDNFDHPLNWYDDYFFIHVDGEFFKSGDIYTNYAGVSMIVVRTYNHWYDRFSLFNQYGISKYCVKVRWLKEDQKNE